MTEKTQTTVTIDSTHVLPRTLVLKAMPIPGGEAIGVYGSEVIAEGATADVWCASFFDEDEAKAWILGSRQFGQAIKGGRIAPRKDSGELPDGTGGEAGGSVREAHEPGSPGRPGSAGELPEQVPLHGGDEVGGGRDTGGSPAAST